jgi:hypothetical protein
MEVPKCPSCDGSLSELEVNGFKLWKCEKENKFFDVDEGKTTEINEKWYRAIAGEKPTQENIQ